MQSSAQPRCHGGMTRQHLWESFCMHADDRYSRVKSDRPPLGSDVWNYQRFAAGSHPQDLGDRVGAARRPD
eukprot:14790736-Alexandrium_andersonii.AAC.1